MPTPLKDLFQTLAAFSPAPRTFPGAPWEAYAEWAVGQGLGPLAAYNLEYRLGASSGVPEGVRDRLLGIYQGTVNDNVMKMVGFKRAVDELEGRRFLLVGAASFADALYPHVAFRPVIDLHLVVPPGDATPFANFLKRADYRPAPDEAHPKALVLTDGRCLLTLHENLVGDAAEDEGLFLRSSAYSIYGPSARRLSMEDALLVQVLLISRAGFEVPLIELVDVRELLLGAPSMGGVYSRPLDAEAVRRRAKVWGCERGLWVLASLAERLFPETRGVAEAVKPSLSFPVRELLERLVVAPLSEVGREQSFRGEEALRALLA
jgi:hypothetical protein